jgi:hypothetical protein
MARKTGAPDAAKLVRDDIVPDSALQVGDERPDRFDHQAIADRVCDLVCVTDPPINIALFGPWGSGKSSFYALLKQKLKGQDSSIQVARYDAWKYGGESLKRNFITSVAHDLGFENEREFDEELHQDREENRLDLGGWLVRNWGALVIGGFIAIAVAAAWLLLFGYVSMLIKEEAFRKAISDALPSAGTVLGLTIAALVVGPKMLESANVKVSEAAPVADDQFARSFRRLVKKATKGGDRRLVVFIDELDRCEPKDVVSTLIDLKTFLDEDGCVFVVAADREVLERALREVPQAKPVREDEPYYSTPGAFLDKVFQHQLALPPLRPQALTEFARKLVRTRGGIWETLRSAEPDDRLFDRVIYTLVPAHVRSPRRVKVLLNNYATDVRVAQSRKIDWLVRATELAKLTVLKTEFPAVAADLLAYPRLLEMILDPPASPPDELRRKLANYVVDYDSSASELGPAGELLADDDDNEASQDERRRAVRDAEKLLRQQLRQYLTKTRAENIPDPRPDLIYLQSAGASDGVSDPRLGEVLDFASDTAPDEVVAAFASELSRTRARAARHLAAASDGTSGPNRANLIEEACRLFETLDTADAREVAAAMASSVRVVVGSADRRPSMIPGALAVAVHAANVDLIETLVSGLSTSAVSDEGLLLRIVPVLADVSDEQAPRIEDVVGGAYYEQPEPLHGALATLPTHAARRLWNSQHAAVESALTRLARDQEGEAEELATPSTQGRATTAPAQSATPPDEEEVAETEAPSERYEALVRAVEARTEPDPDLNSGVLQLGQRFADDDVRTEARRFAERTLGELAAVARSRHAIEGVLRDTPQSWGWWSQQIVSGNNVESKLATDALVRAVGELNAVSGSPLDEIEPVVRRVLSVTPVESDLSAVVASFDGAVSALPWDDGGRPRRRAAYAVGRALAERESTADAVASTLSQDVMRALEEEPSDELQQELVSVVELMPPAAAKATDEELSRYESSDSDVTTVVLLRLICAARFGGSPLAASAVAPAITGGGGRVLDAWLRLAPEVDEVIRTIKGEAWPGQDTLAAYSTGLDDESRSKLWIHLESRNAPVRVLTAAASGAVTAEAVDHIRRKVDRETRQQERDRSVARLLTADLSSSEAHKASSEFAEHLLRTEVNGNVPLAARLVIHTKGGARGHIETLRGLFDTAVGHNDKILTKELKSSLRDVRLLSKSKSRLEKIFGR